MIDRIKNGMLKGMYREAKWMYTYVSKYKCIVVFYIILGIIGTGMCLASSVDSKELIDAVKGFDLSWVVTIIGMSIGNIVVGSITSIISTKTNIKVGNEIRVDIYDKIINTHWKSM